MNSNKSSGSNGWVVFLAVVGGIFLLTKILPVLSKILSAMVIIGFLLLIVGIILVIYYACKGEEKKTEENDSQQTSERNGYVRNDRPQNGGYVRNDQTSRNQAGSYCRNGQNPGTNYRQNTGNTDPQGNNGYTPNQNTNYRQGTGFPPNQNTNYRQGTGTSSNQGGGYNNPSGNNGQGNPVFNGKSGQSKGSSNREKGNPSGQQGKQAIPPCNLSPEAMKILTKGRNHLGEIRRLLYRISNLNVKKRGEDICVEIEKILGALHQQPEDIPMVRQFFNYYLPTLGNILLKYLRLEEAGMATEQTTVKVMSCMGEIKVAMERQYAAIFENDILDLTVEMESLTQAVKRDGLLVSEDFTIRDGDRVISLTV